MNDCKFSGRPTKDPEIRYTEGAQPTAIARYTLAVDRRYKKEGGQQADFLSIVAFGKTAEFVERYIRKGIKIIVECHAQSGSYTNKDGNKVHAAFANCECGTPVIEKEDMQFIEGFVKATEDTFKIAMEGQKKQIVEMLKMHE